MFDHVGGGTFDSWSRPQVVRTRYRSLFRFFAKHRSPASQLGLRITVGALAAIRALPLLVVAPATARAYLDVLRMAVSR